MSIITLFGFGRRGSLNVKVLADTILGDTIEYGFSLSYYKDMHDTGFDASLLANDIFGPYAIRNRRPIPDTTWNLPRSVEAEGKPQEVHLNSAFLTCNLPFAFITDSAGSMVFDTRAEQGKNVSPFIEKGVDVGEGWQLKSLSVDKDRKEWISVCQKQQEPISGAEASVLLNLLDPKENNISFTYTFDGSPSEKMSIKLMFDNKHDLGSTINILDPVTNNQVDLLFSSEGKLNEVRLGSGAFRGQPGAHREMLKFSWDERGVESIEGEQLYTDPRVTDIMKRLFGVETTRNLTLDKDVTLRRLIKQLDKKDKRNPRDSVVFKQVGQISA